MSGYFITLEGGEGAGKTTVLPLLKEKLSNLGYDVLLTREPGGIEIAEKIRDIVLDKNHPEMDRRTEALLFAAARRQHLVQKVLPALKAGKIVVCDRFIDSSLAYQGYASGLDMEEVFMVNQFAIEDTMPDITIFFDISPQQGLERIAANTHRERNRLDLENLAYHEKVYTAYRMLLQKDSRRIKAIDASQRLEQVANEAMKVITNFLQDH
ncbi:dTMP kinase [Virgibacillus halophilus]|uniref:Thymidylate kinase n=1 Tax=Tigheibacillus halophilus TaxID=361280 RepID=A0ABU5C6K2_9BACI|nr:dTMP kinase [Virgibacillus halophilus]